MPWITSLILAAFAGYGAAWYFGAIEGNFELLLLLATIVTGIYWAADKLLFAPRRRKAVRTFEAQHAAAAASAADSADSADSAATRDQLLEQPWWLDWTAGLFPVILIVFLLRAFVAEPFKIPSGSMIPTLHIGDLILVNKFTYGLRVPVSNDRITQGKPIARGDVVVFKFPLDTRVDYIKRVIGLPGDTITYANKRLTINGKEVPQEAMPQFFDESTAEYFTQYREELPGHPHRIIVNDRMPSMVGQPVDFPDRSACTYSMDAVTCKVPQGHYFMMGDNRDNSYDSRYWGFVPDHNVVGKAFFIWMNFGDLKQIGPIH